MKKQLLFALFAACAVVLPQMVLAATVGSPAPNFSLKGQDGKTYSLSDFKGKHVVLEWYNKDCPYVRKHYDSGNMQSLQKEFTEKGVVWLSLISSADGQQGYLTPEQAKEVLNQEKASPTALLFDPSGATGKAYDAKTTPHMYVIDPNGTLVYAGGIDDKPSTRESSLKGATPYFANAVRASLSGEPISPSTTKPYGCSIKYKN